MKERAGRYQRASEVRAALEAVQGAVLQSDIPRKTRGLERSYSGDGPPLCEERRRAAASSRIRERFFYALRDARVGRRGPVFSWPRHLCDGL